MLLISRLGPSSAHAAPTIEALYTSLQAGADMLTFDVYLTKDKIPVATSSLGDTPSSQTIATISRHTFSELYERSKERPIVPLSQILDEFFGVILLLIELKGRGTGQAVTRLVQSSYIKRADDWDNTLLSSLRRQELSDARHVSSSANLALMHDNNPFTFIAFHRQLRLAAVGFHRLYINSFALDIAKRSGLFTYAFTINRPESAITLTQKGLDGIVTERLDTILKKIEKQL